MQKVAGNGEAMVMAMATAFGTRVDEGRPHGLWFVCRELRVLNRFRKEYPTSGRGEEMISASNVV